MVLIVEEGDKNKHKKASQLVFLFVYTPENHDVLLSSNGVKSAILQRISTCISAMRLSWKTIASIGLPVAVVLLAITIITWIFASRATAFMDDALRTYLRTSAGLAAAQIDPDDVRAIRNASDIELPEYRRLVGQLYAIRNTVASARFAYIFRETEQAMQLAFVADGDALLAPEVLDVNGNGVVDLDEEAGMPGDLYDISNEPMLQGPAFLNPVAGDFYVDQWGELISGYAPIRAPDGTVVGVLGIDMQAGEFRRLARSIISPLAIGVALGVSVLVAVYIGVIVWMRQIQGLKLLAAERSALIDLAMHQIGAPLAAFRWWTDILQEQGPADEKTRTEALAQLHFSVQRMETVIQAMQSASRIAKGEVTYESHIADLNGVIDAVAKDLQKEVIDKKRTLNVVAEPNLQCTFDPRLIRGVLEELVKNAVAYGPEDTPITIHARRVRDRIEVSVHDDGGAISAADLAKIFQPFTRGEDAYRKQPVGNGMGLYVSRHIIEIGGGTMTVESTPEKGTTVTFTLPGA